MILKFELKPFEGITEIDKKEVMKENPLKNYDFPIGMFESNPFDFFDSDIRHWETVLKNRIGSVNRDFGYAMFYFYKGISDGDRNQYSEQDWRNFFNFIYFVDGFFLKAYTVFETIGHLLYKRFNFKSNNYISFKNSIQKINKVNKQLHYDLNRIQESTSFKNGVKMRNDIAHNHPPQHPDSGMRKEDGLLVERAGEYTIPSEIKAIMIGYLKSIKQTIDIFKNHFID